MLHANLRKLLICFNDALLAGVHLVYSFAFMVHAVNPVQTRVPRLVPILWFACVFLHLVHASAQASGDEDEYGSHEFFEAKIRPVLVQHCYECHSVGSSTIQGGLQVDFRDGLLKGGDTGPGIVPKSPDKSLILEALRYESLKMPPSGKLPPEVVRDFQRWIESGAFDPRDTPPSATTVSEEMWKANLAERRLWWSLQPPILTQPPPTEDPTWMNEPIDRFIRAATKRVGLSHAPQATPDVLLRRLSFVLTGLPPSHKDIIDFQMRWQENPDSAYTEVVERLLESPHFGERFARHWMDVMHYTDTYGYEWDIAAKGSWEYRDYLIRAFNTDVGFDQLIREQIAGDLLPEPRMNGSDSINESLIGPMFFHFGERRHGSSIDFAGVHQEMVDSQIDAFSKSFLAMTVACARCHDHKLDAISQRDYYALASVFMTPRWTSRNIDAASKYETQIAKLRQIRSEIHSKLGQVWQKQLNDSPLDLFDLAQKSKGDSSFDSLGYPIAFVFREMQSLPISELHAQAEQSTTKLVLEEDGMTILATGAAIPATDTYTIQFKSSAPSVSELQLEALTHPSLGQTGPGRTPHGNFVLSQIQIQTKGINDSEWRDVAIQSAHADYEQPGYPIAAALNADAVGWGVGLGGNVPRTARFHFDQSIMQSTDSHWKVLLHFQLGSSHTLGRFRISLRSDAAPSQPNEPMIVERWGRLQSQWQQENERRRAHNARFTVLADFSAPQFPDGWVVEGGGIENGWVSEATPRIALDGGKILSKVLPRGLHSHALSPKLAGAVRLPETERFPRTHVSVLAAGGSWAGYRQIPQNAFLNEGPVFFDPASSPAWITLAPSPLKHGVTRVLSEFSTPDLNANFPPRTGVARMGATTLPNEDNGFDKNGWFSVTKVVAHDTPGHPIEELDAFADLFDNQKQISIDSITNQVFEWMKGAVGRWSTKTSVPGDAKLIAWLIEQGILGNDMTIDPELAKLVHQYREVEAEIGFARSVNSMDERSVKPIDYRLNIRGDVHNEGSAVQRDFLEVFKGQHRVKGSNGSGRLELANYLSSPENPQTARVYVNRVWQWIFGIGLVETPSDFGKLGGRPSHPELLDWLALQFMQEGWSTKRLVRRLVLSETFRQSGQVSPKGKEVDPGNRLLHHYPTRRLEAEAIRDSLLAASGRLDRTLYGRPIRPHRSATDSQKRLFSGPLDGHGRRSICLEMSVMQPPEFLVGFNLPDLKIPTGRRDITNVPAQALLLMNSQFVNDMSQHWGSRLIGDLCAHPEERITNMFLSAFGRQPSQAELSRWCAAALEFSDGKEPLMKDHQVWSQLAHAMFNTKEFLYYR